MSQLQRRSQRINGTSKLLFCGILLNFMFAISCTRSQPSESQTTSAAPATKANPQSADRTLAAPPTHAAKIFNHAIEEIRDQVKVPILLPAKLPDTIHENEIKMAFAEVLEG